MIIKDGSNRKMSISVANKTAQMTPETKAAVDGTVKAKKQLKFGFEKDSANLVLRSLNKN